MVRTKLILVAIVALLTIGSTGIWLFLSDSRAAQGRRADFFGASRDYPTSGGQKMKVEW
ncbi:entry exclusion protein TrbK [Rhizobium multihospitium]|uniref:Entry exclusion protein TrbK, Ti-type n=1 Tax=Rhizobium multihospitium TaxID=410764 RepID=A0A1C3XBS9_9HYPH|nr:entry exclusion protein TrbK [Rhizobium multihospitium]SCB49615.1 entry exclusion protein TrbK, Ti-type [Rhizobium multihospitium]